MELDSHRDSRPAYDVLIPGDYFCDVIFTGLTEFPALGTEIYGEQITVVPGGGAINTSVGMKRLGMKPGWIGRLGNDFFSKYIDQLLLKEEISMALVERLEQPLRRVTVALSYPADRAFVTHVDQVDGWLDRALMSLELVQTRHVHFPGLVIDARLPAMLDRCHELGISVSMDCQHRDDTITDPLVQQILSRLDIFTPNVQEATRLAQTDQVQKAIEILTTFVPYLIIKQGALGALARCGGQEFYSPAIPNQVVDTTGAGDAFNAGFLTAYLQGHDPADCLAWGNFCGSRSVTGIGGTQALPTLEQLQQWLESRKVATHPVTDVEDYPLLNPPERL